ncbi:4-hydroxyphenylacetate 3-hydroxylase N-terminal domain-containing protein [Streptomyces sp. NPDC086077]|uniref:4-hydroxyphenylacetate 3-hydroxylase N-terminal domain-containing protein n=1 Tax=Streptomyces sp. NPDC086077 TaxID=3154862 RepID=UPI00343AB526
MRTGDQYLESLRDGRVLWVGGDRVDDVTTHPKTRAQAKRMAKFYDLHHDAELQDVMTFVDDDGVRRSMMWFKHTDAEGLRRKRIYLETVVRELDGGSTGRTPCANNYGLVTYEEDPQPWSDQSVGTDGRDLTVGIREFLDLAKEGDLNCAFAFIDPQLDRSKESSAKNSPALRIVETREDGIVVAGVKAVSTGTPFADYIHLGVFYRPGIQSEQVIYGAVPANAPGVTMVSREATVRDDFENHPVASAGDELECTVIFDNVFIPWNRVFHIGNPEHASLYPQRIFDWVHYEALIRIMVRAELMVGLAMLMTEHIGTYQLPPVQARLARLVEFYQTMRAHVIASETEGFISPAGLYKPNVLLFDFGRSYYLERYAEMRNEVIDLAGRASLLFPTEEQWTNPELREWLEPLQSGAVGEPYDRMRISRVIRDLFLSDYGDRVSTFEQFNGTPMLTTRMLTMKRSELSPSGRLTDLARKVCGIAAPVAPEVTAYTEQAEYARRLDGARAEGSLVR